MATIYEKIEGVIERLCTWTICIALPLVYFVFFKEDVTVEKFIEMNKLVIGVAAIGVGFLGTTKAILVSISESRVMKRIKQSGEYERLLGYLFSGVWSCLALVLLSTLYMLLPLVDGTNFTAISLVVWFAVAGFSIGACVRVIVILNVILKAIK
jgi:membrane protein required for beta-lactamase induction